MDDTPSLQNTLNQNLEGDTGLIDEYFYDLNGDNEINDDYEYYDNLALSLQQGQLPLNFSTFPCFLTKLRSGDLTPELVTPSMSPDSSYEKHISKTVRVSTPSYINIPNMVWNEDNGRYIPQTQTVASQSVDFHFIEDFGLDGCPDSNENGDGTCSSSGSSDFVNGGEILYDVENGIHDVGEEFEDWGIDGCVDEYEDGNGGCEDYPREDCPEDPNGDNNSTEGNGTWEGAEEFTDQNGDGEYNCVPDSDEQGNPIVETCNITNDNYVGEPFLDSDGNGFWGRGEPLTDDKNGIWDFNDTNSNDTCDDLDGDGLYDECEQFIDTNGNGVWDGGDPNNDSVSGDEGDGILDAENSAYINCLNYVTESDCVDQDGDGVRDGFCEWTTFLERADCSNAFTDLNNNGIYEYGEPFIDSNNNDIYDDCDSYVRQNPGVYDDGESFIDVNFNEEWDSYCLDIVNNQWDSSYLNQEDCDGAADRNWVEENFVDAGVYSEGCRHYSDRAEYKVYYVNYDETIMGEVEGLYYIDQDEWVRRDSVYSSSKIEYSHEFDQLKIGPSSQELMSRVNADCNENNARDDAESYVQDQSGCGAFEVFIQKPEEFFDFGIDDCVDIFEDGDGGCLEYENHGIDGEDFVDAMNGVWDEGEVFTDINNNNIGDYYCLDAIDGIWNDNFLAEEGCLDSGHTWVAEDFEDAMNGVYDEGEFFTDINDDGIYDIGCPDQFEDGDGGCSSVPLSSYVEGTDPNGDNDHNNDNYDATSNPGGTEGNGIYDCVVCDRSNPNYEGEDFTDEESGTFNVYDTGFCDRSNQMWDPVEAHLDLGSSPNYVRDPLEPYHDRNCNGFHTEAEKTADGIDPEECNGTWILAGQGIGSNGTGTNSFDFCDVGNGKFDGPETCMDGSDQCNATQLYDSSEKQYGSLLVSYPLGPNASTNPSQLNGAEPFEIVSNGLDIIDRWGNVYTDVIEETQETKIERQSADLVDSIVVVYSNPIIERLDSNYDYDYTIAKSKWQDGANTDYDYHIFRKSDEGYIMKLIHPSYFLPSESFASGNAVSTGGAFWFQDEPEEEVFLYTVDGRLRDGERYQTSRVDVTPVAEYLVEESYAVDAESYTAPLRSLLGVELDDCNIVCGYDENEHLSIDGESNDRNLNGLWDEDEAIVEGALDQQSCKDAEGTWDTDKCFIDSGDTCLDCLTVDDCPTDTTFVECFKVSKEKTTTLLGTGVEYVESNVSYFAKDFGLIRDDSEFRWNVAPGEAEELEGKSRWVMVEKNNPGESDCSEGAGFFNAFISNKKVLNLDEFDQIDDLYHPYKKTRTYGLQRIDQQEESE